MTVRHEVEATVTVAALVNATRVVDGTVVTGTDFDVRSYGPGSRFLLILDAFETNAANTGGTWTVTESLTDGGSYTAATTSGSLAATGAVAGNIQRVVSVYPNPAKPFVHPVFTPADANADVDITATLVVIPRALV